MRPYNYKTRAFGTSITIIHALLPKQPSRPDIKPMILKQNLSLVMADYLRGIRSLIKGGVRFVSILLYPVRRHNRERLNHFQRQVPLRVPERELVPGPGRRTAQARRWALRSQVCPSPFRRWNTGNRFVQWWAATDYGKPRVQSPWRTLRVSKFPQHPGGEETVTGGGELNPRESLTNLGQ